MKYMMLIHHDEAALAAADQKQLWADYAAFNEALAKAAGVEAGLRLQPSSAATTIRSTADNTDIVDGPYADTKEQLAGYFLVDAPDLDEAIAWAKRCPSSRFGSIEIRPLMAERGK
ncbi:MAG TPA: YciI family protein [Devosia sp.]|nr:YciI family protein [Devosia sp.]